MATRSGLDAQVGFGAETTYGTAGTINHFVEFDEENFQFQPTWLEGEGIRAGKKYKRASRVGISRKAVTGQLTFKVPNKGIGLLIKHMIGSSVTTPAQIDSSDAYAQIHTPGDHYGKSLTFQVGRPEPGTGTVQPFTFVGCKCTQWELSLSDGEHLTLSTTWDGRDESTATALAAASYPDAALYNFSHATLKLGGTASTADGETTISGGAAVATVINSISVTGENPMAVERYGIGNAGLKNEPLENDYPTVTGNLDAEFSKSELYDVFKAATPTALQLSLAFGEADTGIPFLFDFIAPAVLLKDAAPSVSGPDLVRMTTEFEVYDDGTNPTFQIKIVSTDTTL